MRGLVDRAHPLPESEGAPDGQRPQPHVQNVRHAEAGHADCDQGYQHALWPLDEADVAAQPQAFGPGLGVRDQAPDDQAEQRDPAEQRVVATEHEP